MCIRDSLKDGIDLKKIYLSITKDEQNSRFQARRDDPLKYWKLTEHDLSMASKWDIYSFLKEQMFNRTSTEVHPWVVINSNNKRTARLSSLRYVLNEFDYPDKNLEATDDWTSEITNYSIEFDGVNFKNLSYEQYKVLKQNQK